MIRIAYRFYRLLTWIRYRLGRRFTPAGSLVLIGCIISGLVGVDIDQSHPCEPRCSIGCGIPRWSMASKLTVLGEHDRRLVEQGRIHNAQLGHGKS